MAAGREPEDATWLTEKVRDLEKTVAQLEKRLGAHRPTRPVSAHVRLDQIEVKLKHELEKIEKKLQRT